jgi:hypothetical protein
VCRTPTWQGDLTLARREPYKALPSTAILTRKPLRTVSPYGERWQVATPALMPKSPLHGKAASCVRQAGVCTPIVGRQTPTCQIGFWAKVLAFPPTAKAGGVLRLKTRHSEHGNTI